jgi:hypothetical protein
MCTIEFNLSVYISNNVGRRKDFGGEEGFWPNQFSVGLLGGGKLYEARPSSGHGQAAKGTNDNSSVRYPEP